MSGPRLDLSAPAVAARLRQASDLSCLEPERRLHSKIGLSGDAIAARLRAASDLRELCLKLGRAGAAARDTRGEQR